MSEMRTKFTRGRKTRRIAAVALVLALILGVGAVFSASAAQGLFKVEVLDNVTADEDGNLTGAVVKPDNSAVDGKSNFSNGVSVNLKTDQVFTIANYSDLSHVNRLELTISERSTNVRVDVSTANGSWKASSSGSRNTKYYYSNSSGIDKTTFDNLMNAITVKCSYKTSSAASVKLTLMGGTEANKSISDSNRLGRVQDLNKGTTYTEVLTFFTYATAAIDTDSVQVHFENDSSDETNENPNPSGRGSVTFDMNVTNVGDGSFLRLGYQLKEATQTWDTSTQVLHGISDNSYRYERPSWFNHFPTYDDLGQWYDSTTGVVTNPYPVTVTVEGLDPEKDYDVRGVVVTNNDTAAYTKAVNVPRVRYTQPVISTLNIGNTAPQQGGTEKEITAAIEFNNRNYDKLSSGPRLQIQLYFTEDRVSNEDSLGNKTDASTWEPVGAAQLKSLEQNDDGSYKTSLNFTARHTLPHTDASKCAYKLVVNDIGANDDDGYYVTKYSEDTFVLDENPPTKPVITAAGLEDVNLENGTAAVGGANSNVALNISGATDLGSGVKEYSYSMYYLESDRVDNFITEQGLTKGSSNQQILEAMKKLSGANASQVCEYTPSTSLVLQKEGDKQFSTLNIAKDGFYCVSVAAVDNVGKTSEPTVAIFRVDLTPPSAPVVSMAAQSNTTERINVSGGALAAGKFREYDDRTYSDDTVWVFIRTDAQAGKVINPEKYQFSINGGLVWRSITSAVNFDNKAAYSTTGGTVKVYDSSYNSANFTYDAAFQLSCNDINGYQTVMVRATDAMGNVSLPSNSASMRTTEVIRPVGTMTHEGIEIAMAMGNTSLENTSLIEADLRNDVALKINEKYFGADHATNASNPMHVLYVGGKLHQCTWTGTNKTACADANCPYKKDSRLYTPSMVNMQGIESGTSEASGSFDWVRFDHTNTLHETVNGKTVTYPTVAFDNANPLHSTANNNIDPTKSTYQTKSGVTRYTAMKDYVVYTGQTAAASSVGALTETNSGAASLAGSNAHTWTTFLGADSYNELGRYRPNSGATRADASPIPKRVYHMVDMTKTKTSTSPSNSSYTFQTGTLSYGENEASWQTIYTLGYYYTSSKDWMFAYNGQSTRKEIFFSTDDTYVYPHSNDGYGFLFNTTIRQNVDGQWVISGYLFGLGTLATNQTASTYQKFIFCLKDVRLDWFANSRVTTQGASFSTSDDFFANLTNSMISSTNGTVTYGSQKITLLARAAADGLSGQTRNYVFVTDGASAEAYVWNAAGKSREQLQAQFDSDIASGRVNSNSVTAGYSKIHWKQKDGTTAYVNTNPSTSVTKNDTVLYVPRPEVDNYSVGDLSKFEDTDDPSTEPHSDSNCYGFGPITFARSSGHGCDNDSLVVFTNVVMRALKARTLSDVITQPKWGTGKVKYILNVSDDSIQDLTDPIMSSNVAWRIQTDKAKFISWGSLINRKTTQNFIDTKIEGNGTYVVSRVTGYDNQNVVNTKGATVNAPGQRSQSKTVAEYIADAYYKSYGIDLSVSGSIPEKVNAMLEKKGTVYSLENARKMAFSVSPESYNNGTANEDFPSGRWYISYNAEGYTGHTSSARFSDALDLKITEPGRYKVFFAPDMSLLGANLKDPSDDMLNPDASNCIFDFVVNEEAVVQPVATIDDSGNITVYDFSIDPDNNLVISDPQPTSNGQQLTGISKTYWRWELAAPFVDPVTKEQSSIVLMKSPVTMAERSKNQNLNPYNGLTIESLTKQVGKLYTESGYNAQTYISRLQSAGDHSLDYKQSGSTIYYDKVPTGATITLYEQVEEVSTRRVLQSGVMKYVVAGTTKSAEKSTNLINANEAGQKPIRPASSLTLSKTAIYDTAETTDYLTVTRGSFHGQKEDLDLKWSVMDSAGVETILTTSDNGRTWKMGSTTVMQSVTAPSFDATTGRTAGAWKVDKNAIKTLSGNHPGSSFSLSIWEGVKSTLGGNSNWLIKDANGSVVVAKEEYVTDHSSRAIYYEHDERAPAIQTVTMETGTLGANGTTWNYSDYEASGYLDMTTPLGQPGAKQIRVTVSGSSDSEGKVAGYGYYFYDGSTDPTKANYYYQDANGRLVKTGVGLAGAKAAVNVSSGRGILKKAGSIGEKDEFYVTINENTMIADGVARTPTAVLNLAVFAFDNQTGITSVASGAVGNLTGANETMRTKIENIKLAKFTPMPVAISAVNTTGETISRIGNDKALTGGHDTIETLIPVANTNVTVSFAPRQDWFQVVKNGAALSAPERVTDKTLLEQLESTGDTTGQYIKYFTDKSGQADLTNRVTIDYKVERKAPGASDYVELRSETGAAYTSTVSINEGGDYRVTAKARNGSGVYSAEQVLTFSVDRERPTMPTVVVYDDKLEPYTEGTWVQGVSIRVRDSEDADPLAYYQYSLDNGATWKRQPNLDNFDISITETGTHYVRVKAVDTGGNESEAPLKTIMVDNTPPRVSPPNMEPASQSTTVFKECIVSISQTAGGVVYSLNDDNTANEADQDVIVEPGAPAAFVIIPDAGKRVFDIKLGETAYSPADLTPHATIAGGLVLNVPEIDGDAALQVTFEDELAPANYMATARAASFNAVRSMRAAAPAFYSVEDAPAVAAASHVLDIYEDLDATITTPDLGFDIPNGQNVVLDIEVVEGYRVTELVIERAGSAAETVTAAQLTAKGKNHLEYVLQNVTTDVMVRVKNEKKTPTTVTLDVDGNGTITVDNAVKGANDTYNTYVDDVLVLTVEPMTGYTLGSLKVDGVEQVSGTAVSTYSVPVTANMKMEAKFVIESTDPMDTSYVTVLVNPTNGTIRGTISPRGEVTTDSATGAERHVIPVLTGGDQTILLKPDATYQPANIVYTIDADSSPTTTTPAVEIDEATGYYKVKLSGVIGAAESNILSVDFTGKQHKITVNTVAKEPGQDDTSGGGTVTINDDAISEADVPEGTDVTVKITPDAGYRIEGVTLNGREMGKRRSLDLKYVDEDYEIVATFLKRSFGAPKTSHSMLVTAVGISDGQEALHNEAYSFKLNNGAWSAFQAGTNITYTDLQPNSEYTVTVRARDRRGNISSEVTKEGENARKKYTWANMPAALDVEAADDTDNVMDKTVKITVDPMGNPADTEYCVYFDDRSDMRNRALAAVQPDGGKWSTLDGLGQITVYRLAPGTTYYLQVAARNKDGIPTEANDQNVLKITLSPTAPPDNTLYFEEQPEPGAPITLRWDDPAGEVEGFQIYRDGTLIDEVGKNERSYEDSYSNLRGDGVFVYSYAYRNSAGVGARRTAVSEEYHAKAAAVAAAKEAGDQTAISAAEAELKKLDDLKGTDYPNLYKEVMTYPTFPAYFTKVYAMPLGITTYNGQMVLRIQPESGTAARAQRYVVGLHAYKKNADGTYELVPDGTKYGDPANQSTWSSAATEKATVCTSSSGATVSWDGLDINWEYRVYVKSVTSTGWTTYDNNGNVSDGYQSGTAISVETALHKRYVVDYQGYGYEYGVSGASGVLNVPGKTMWTDATADAFTTKANDTYTGWNHGSGDGIELSNRSADESDSYIKFNKSPQVFIPKTGSSYDTNFLYGTSNTELSAYGNRYLVVQQEDGSMKVQLHVKVYDPDGPADGNLNYTVTGTLGGVVAKTTIAPAAADQPAVGDEDHPTECVLEFDLKNLATGVYDDLKLSVANGSIDVPSEAIPAGTVKLVVNQSLPTISASNGGGTKKIEDGRNYGTESKLKVTANVSANNQENLRKVRMILMEDQYKKAGLDSLFQKVMNGTASTAECASIDAVQLPMTSYFQVSAETYAAAQAIDPSKVTTTNPTTGTTYYWVEKELALQNGWCDFLTRDASGNMTVHKKADDPYGTTYPVLMTACFGKNQSAMNLRFQVMAQPSLTVETEQTWQWVKTTSEEYVAYEEKATQAGKATWTIGDVYDESVANNALNDNSLTPSSLGFNHADPALQKTTTPDGDEYMVFKLWDKKATIQSTEVSSYIQVKTGMYSQIEEAQVVMVPEVSSDPSGSDEHAAPPAADSKPAGYTGNHVIKVSPARYQGGTVLRDNTRPYFRVSNLDVSTTYYMWVYYKVEDPESGEMVWYHAKNYIAMTTDSDYKVSTVGFQEASRSYEESEYDATGRTETATLVRFGDYGASSVKVAITAEYYRATQYGEYEVLRDADGEPILDSEGNEQKIQIMPGTPEYQLAAETVTLLNAEREIPKDNSQIGVQYQIRNTDSMQGHMIVRLVEKVVGGTGDGINRETTNAETFEIFVLDDESPITSYKAGLDELDGLTFEEDGDSHMVAKHYDYKFGGLPDPYGSADTSSLSLAIKNTGDGELNEITATLWNKERTAESTEFVFATPPTLTSLASPEEGILAAAERSLVKIVPADGLTDGVHEGWLKITADRVKDADVVWVHLYQVVGQATLKGNIYIGEAKPETTSEHVGKATVKIYSSSTSTGANRGDPLYQAETNDNGYFEIPNILTQQEYCIVVERIGCATYDGLVKRWTWTPRYSANYLFDLRMVAGDINGDAMVNSVDRTELEKYMNHSVAEAEEKGLTDLAEAIRKCDLDQNGGVNSIDRMLLWQNLNKGTTTGGITILLYKSVTPTRIAE